MKILEVRERDRDLDAAVKVCARWRMILQSARHLWTKVDFEYPARASCYIQRSGGSPIDVLVGKTKDTIIGPVGAFLGATPWVARMKSLYIGTQTEQIKKIAELLCQRAPQLKSLTFEGKARRYAYPPHDRNESRGAIYVPREFLGRHAPLLQSLTFHSVVPSVVFNFPMPNLTYIDWVAETAHIVIEELLELFASCPLLQIIKINVLIRRTQIHTPLKQVTLEHLRKLDWADHDGCLSPIPCMTAPKLTDLTLKLTSNPLFQRPTLASFLSSEADRIPLLAKPSVVKYTYNCGIRSLRCGYGEAASLAIREATTDRVVGPPVSHWFPQDIPLSFSATQELSIEAIGGCPDSDDVPILLFESLRKLEFAGESDPLISLISSVPSVDLTEIQITPKLHYFPLDGVAEAIKNRNRSGIGKVTTVRIAGKSQYLRPHLSELGKVVEIV